MVTAMVDKGVANALVNTGLSTLTPIAKVLVRTAALLLANGLLYWVASDLMGSAGPRRKREVVAFEPRPIARPEPPPEPTQAPTGGDSA